MAALTEPMVQVDDLATDPRWPLYGQRVSAMLGLGSQVAFQFHAEPHARGALTCIRANRTGSIRTRASWAGCSLAWPPSRLAGAAKTKASPRR